MVVYAQGLILFYLSKLDHSYKIVESVHAGFF